MINICVDYPEDFILFYAVRCLQAING